MTDIWGDLVWAALADLKTRLVLVLPGVLAMLTLAVVGLAGAWIAARVTRRLAQAVAFDRRAESWGIVSQLSRAGVRRPPSQVLGLVVFWSILVLFLSMAIDALAIPGTGRLTEFVFSWVPRVMGAALILLVGWLVANFLGEGALIGGQCARAGGAPARSRDPLGRAALRERDRDHPPRHRQGDGAGGLRHHLRRLDLRLGAGLRPRGPCAGPPDPRTPPAQPRATSAGDADPPLAA